jgi:hypothetical protein
MGNILTPLSKATVVGGNYSDRLRNSEGARMEQNNESIQIKKKGAEAPFDTPI